MGNYWCELFFIFVTYQINVILAISDCWLSGYYKIWKKRKKSNKFNRFQIGVFFFPNIRDRRQKPFEFLNSPPSLLNRQPSFFMVQCLDFILMWFMLTLLAHALYILYVLFSRYLYYIYFILVYWSNLLFYNRFVSTSFFAERWTFQDIMCVSLSRIN